MVCGMLSDSSDILFTGVLPSINEGMCSKSIQSMLVSSTLLSMFIVFVVFVTGLGYSFFVWPRDKTYQNRLKVAIMNKIVAKKQHVLKDAS